MVAVKVCEECCYVEVCCHNDVVAAVGNSSTDCYWLPIAYDLEANQQVVLP